MKNRIIVCLVGLCCLQQAFGYSKDGTVYTTDGSQADVSSAIAAAGVGDTVKVPPGTFTWGANGSFLSINKAITLQGVSDPATDCAAANSTTIINLSSTGGSFGNGVIRPAGGATVRDMRIIGPATGTVAFLAVGNGWRVTNIDYRGGSGGGYFLYTEGYGLIDHSTINGAVGTAELIFARGPTDSWQTDQSMGTARAVYVENCTFAGQGYVSDFNANARGVVRYCAITGQMKVDGHGKASNTPARGVRQVEVYGNHWKAGGYYAAIELRGGTGRVFDNTTDVASGSWFFLTEYGTRTLCPNFGNLYQTPANYAVDDQIGTGKDPRASGSEPMYLWNNRRGDVPWTLEWQDIPAEAIAAYGSSFTMQDVIAPDRDYFMDGTSFTGTSGVGVGTRAQMDAISPTKTGVGFWVTDRGEWNSRNPGPDGQLFVWDGSAWVLNYTPYTYPYPVPPSRVTGVHTVVP